MNSSYDAFAAIRADEFANKKNFTHAYIEKPAMYELLPDVKGKDVLCVGCGTGEECLELKMRGAKVIGFDNSAASIAYAKQHVEGVSFSVADMDNEAAFQAMEWGQFSLIYSSLTFHYSNDLQVLLSRLYGLLRPGGYLLFSVGHPLRWAAKVAKHGDSTTVLMGYTKQKTGLEVYGNYLETQLFTQQLSDGPEVTYWMRPISSYFDMLSKTGFTLKAFKEPVPIPEAREADQANWELRTKMPVDMIFLAQR